MGYPYVFYYTVILPVIPAPDPGDASKAGPPVITSPRVLMEHYLFDMRIRAERADLTDGRRVFRVEDRWLDRMQHDALGFFVSFAKLKFYWVPVDPVTVNDTYERYWGPL